MEQQKVSASVLLAILPLGLLCTLYTPTMPRQGELEKEREQEREPIIQTTAVLAVTPAHADTFEARWYETPPYVVKVRTIRIEPARYEEAQVSQVEAAPMPVPRPQPAVQHIQRKAVVARDLCTSHG